MREAREGLSLALWVLVGVLAVACAVGGIQVAQAHDARARQAAQHARYDATLDAATAEATAFVNVSHETAEDDLARIAAGLHYRHSMFDGERLGRRVARHVTDHHFQPRGG